jgi:hypothetical protein
MNTRGERMKYECFGVPELVRQEKPYRVTLNTMTFEIRDKVEVY